MSFNYNDIIELMLGGIDRLPNPPREKLKAELTKLKEIYMENRPPRLVIVGRRGAGKSSLINAIFMAPVAAVGSITSETGKSKWHEYQGAKGSMRIMDTRGLGDRTKPDSAQFETAIDEIKPEIEKVCPDALLFLCKAKEVDAHVSEDLKGLGRVRELVHKAHGYELPLIAVVTQVDELDPASCMEPPFEHPKKQAHIQDAVSTIQDACKTVGLESIQTIPIAAYAEWEGEKIEYSRFWNIDTLVDYLVDQLPRSAQLQLARIAAIKRVQTKLAKLVIGSTATICAGIAATPIPVADIIPITAAQLAMVVGIAYIGGREISKDSAIEFLGAMGVNLGAGFALREAARALVKLLPVAGEAVSAGVAFTGTWALGAAAIAYFLDGKSIDECKADFENTKKEKQAENAVPA
jgi:predicted GTPase